MKTPEDFAIDFFQHMKECAEGKEIQLTPDMLCLVEAATSIQLSFVLQQLQRQGKEGPQIGAESFIPQGNPTT